MSLLNSLRAATAKASVNLRGDLAKLSDAELAERLEVAWESLESAQAGQRGRWSFGLNWNIGLWRGPLRHPRAYRFLWLFDLGGGGWLATLLSSVFSGKRFERFVRKDAPTNEYLSLCEIRDIMDEIDRRLAQRRAGQP
jgi:hypothetical protein